MGTQKKRAAQEVVWILFHVRTRIEKNEKAPTRQQQFKSHEKTLTGIDHHTP